MSAAEWEAERFTEAIRLLGLRPQQPARAISVGEQEWADVMADRILTDREFAAVGWMGDEGVALARWRGEAS